MIIALYLPALTSLYQVWGKTENLKIVSNWLQQKRLPDYGPAGKRLQIAAGLRPVKKLVNLPA
jgi:hypothetical protein